ncbi:hypothetical protein [Thalassospira alkalitolerans]|uniref:hypothetical protein n=1 Tax=Thalassospira alkalitolerans TaxID=1293890 RepID=UPI003AA8F647
MGEKIIKEIISTSVLIDQGRMFFKNSNDDYGGEKPESRRGMRPKILDHILVAHLVAIEVAKCSDENEEMRLKLTSLINEHLGHFISIAQHEVGRSKSISPQADVTGTHIEISGLLKDIKDRK